MKNNPLISHSRRAFCLGGMGLFLLTACEAKTKELKPMNLTMNIMMYSYLDRPIFDVFVGKVDFGVAGPYPDVGSGTMMGVTLPMGSQVVSWRLGDTGETVKAKNIPVLKDVPKNARYLCLHIYQDETVEFVFSEYLPDPTPRGEMEIEKLRNNHEK